MTIKKIISNTVQPTTLTYFIPTQLSHHSRFQCSLMHPPPPKTRSCPCSCLTPTPVAPARPSIMGAVVSVMVKAVMVVVLLLLVQVWY